LKGKESAVNDFIGYHQLDFMTLVETWHDGDRAPSIGNVFASISYKANERHHRGIVFILNPSLKGRASVRYRNSNQQILIVDIDDISIVATYWEPGLTESAAHHKMDIIRQHTGQRPFIICGDLNAKIDHRSFDNTWNTAGRIVWAWAEETELEIIQPTKGRYTFFQYRNGQLIRSALDYVISAQVPVTRMTVHEDDSIGGSDHRPITFCIPQKPKGRKFFRWNVRKLNDPEIRTRYTEVSKELAPILRSDLNSTDNVNVAWDLIKRWIRRSAQQSCGRFCYNGFRISGNDTEEIRLAKMRLKEITTKMAQGDELAHLDFQLASATLAELVQEQERLNRQTLANELSSQQNAASLLKIISNRKSQRSRAHCRLRVTDMQAHVQHFRSTFGRPHPTSSFRDEENTGIDPTSVETVGDVSLACFTIAITISRGCLIQEFCYHGDHSLNLYKTGKNS
jgi:exonuclease III